MMNDEVKNLSLGRSLLDIGYSVLLDVFIE
ncbi:hypothetical protein BMS3Abin05_01412 [bacterium BMS3Abin05]|nr:hypothetical protein BMS3Abin05_01412 [bacterium BMS3Abin05]